MTQPAGKTRVWTTRQLLAWTTRHFEHKGIDSPRLATEMLLAHVLGVNRLGLYMDPDRPAGELERAAFRELVERAANHEPVDYLVGKCPFFSLMLKVNRDVLIPRPSTETLVEHVLQHQRVSPGFATPLIADIGTGSGAIAIALAKNMPKARVIATDISEPALQLARENAVDQKVQDRIDFLKGDLFEPVFGQRFAYLCGNPPYISDAEWDQVAPNVKDYEPQGALRGGTDGLQLIRPIIEQAHRYLVEQGQLVVEIAASQNKAVLQLVEAAKGLTNPRILTDHEGLPRVLVADAAR